MKSTNKTNEAKKVTKKGLVKREILGRQLSKNLPNEVKAIIDVINEATEKGTNGLEYTTFYLQYLVALKKYSKSQSNLRTRFDRIISNSIAIPLVRNSVQSAKFNLNANLKGIKILPKNPLQFNERGIVDKTILRNNYFKFVTNKTQTVNLTLKATKGAIEEAKKIKGDK